MSEEDDPLARGGNWRCLSISFDDPRAMEQMGPNLEVSIAAVTEQGTTSATIADFLKEGLDSGQAVVGNQTGDAQAALADAAKVVEALYAWV